jgi:glyoxylase-like metal-dependent hydrolase (beta-lactamase superfamily II)
MPGSKSYPNLQSIREVHVFKTIMPFPLKDNNCFLAESDKGWVAIDTGVNMPANQAIWQYVLKQIGISFKHIDSIYLSHYHHDHIGLAGWLQQQSGAEVYMPYEDLLTFTNYVACGNYYGQVKNTCVKEGWPVKLVQDLASDINSIDRLIRPLPELKPYYENDHLYLNGQKYEILNLPGHSDGHLVFYGPDTGVLLSGDNIVNHTILQITDWPHTRLINPLDMHLAQLNNLLDMEINLVLPGHGDVFKDLGVKIHQINRHHKNRKEVIYNHLTSPCSAWELAQQMFNDSEYIHIKRLNLAETVSYLSSLVVEGRVTVTEYQEHNIYERVHD